MPLGNDAAGDGFVDVVSGAGREQADSRTIVHTAADGLHMILVTSTSSSGWPEATKEQGRPKATVVGQRRAVGYLLCGGWSSLASFDIAGGRFRDMFPLSCPMEGL